MEIERCSYSCSWVHQFDLVFLKQATNQNMQQAIRSLSPKLLTFFSSRQCQTLKLYVCREKYSIKPIKYKWIKNCTMFVVINEESGKRKNV